MIKQRKYDFGWIDLRTVKVEKLTNIELVNTIAKLPMEHIIHFGFFRELCKRFNKIIVIENKK